MGALPCDQCKGLCCGPVPVTKRELREIRRQVAALPQGRRAELAAQTRHVGTCIFYDLDRDLCGIYEVRPAVCRAFGHYSNLICFRDPLAAAVRKWQPTEDHVGFLSINFMWKDFA